MSPKQRLTGKVAISVVIALLVLPGFVLSALREAGRDVFALSLGITTGFWLVRAAWQDYEAEKRRSGEPSEADYKWVRQ